MSYRAILYPPAAELDSHKDRRELFLDKMEQAVPWALLEGVVESIYPRSGNDRFVNELRLMLRIYFLQQWFNLPDSTVFEALDQSPAMRRFAGVEPGHARTTSEAEISRFHRLLAQHSMSKEMAATANRFLDPHAVPNELRVKVGDGVFIFNTQDNGSIAEVSRRFTRVTAVRPKSFDAGGLCFKYDGREWRGRSMVRLTTRDEEAAYFRAAPEPSRVNRPRPRDEEREDAILAARFSYRDEREWQELGLVELRRIADLLGIGFTPTEPPEYSIPMSNGPAEGSAPGLAASGQLRGELAPSTFENLFEFSPDAIFLAGPDGRICAANPRAAELFGYAQAELAGRPIESLIPERFRGRHPSHRENYNAHPRARQMGAAMDLFGLRSDGTEFPVDIMLKPMETPTGPIVVSFVRDMTEQRAALEALRRNDESLRSIVESVRDYAIYHLDNSGHVTTWNPGAERIKGYAAEEIVGRHFSRFFVQEDIDRGRPEEMMRQAALRGRVENEGWRVRKDGSRFWADSILTAIRDAAGEISGYAKVTRDFTDRKRAEEAVMLQLSGALLAGMDVRKLLGAISASIREVIPHDSATLALFDPASGDLLAQFLQPDEGEPMRGDIRLAVRNSPAGAAFQTREPLLLDRMESSSFAPASMRHFTIIGMHSGCWVPLIHRGEAIGTMAVASRMESSFSQPDADMLLQIAGQVAMAVHNAIAFRRINELRDRLSQEKQYLEEEINLEKRFDDIVGGSAGLRNVLRQIETVAPTDATVLIQGETGTGKELLARALHRLSPRHERTFIKLNCAAIPAGLIESELFGHEKGAFTGAIARKIGRLELAHDGTLFLDEIGELPLDLQPKLLRALQEREIERVGGNRPIQVNVRLIAATNRDLARMVAEKQFRSDLYYRLKVFPVFAPPLRERLDDIPVLVRHFVAMHSRRMGKTIAAIPEETMAALVRWQWPGNIRELENFIERAVILTRGSVLYVPLAELEIEDEDHAKGAASRNPTLHAAEREHILRVLREAGGQIGGVKGAAARLGLKRTTLNSKMKKLGIERNDEIKSQ
jgi:PAS domain S-box-containing protein